MTPLELKLEAKAQRVLLNPLEIDEDVVILSLAEAVELTDSKPIKETLLLDLALLRLKENLKIELSEYEQKCFLNIIKTAQNTPSVNEVDGSVDYAVEYGKRESQWDM
ncbi:MAG: hypothetical protein IBX44_02550 [Sulfurospirillum sp.]|nr:hypothetical protein [Sulfurospirillum sp.]